MKFMDKKRILIVCSGFYPGTSPRAHRATELAKEFALQGHEVVVLTPENPKQIDFAKEHQVQIKDLGKLRWKAINFGASKMGSMLTRLAGRLLQLSMEYPDIEYMFKVKKALQKEKDYDLLISIAVPYPIHWGVALVRNKKHPIANTWIADCGDPYVGDKMDTFKKWFYFKYIEKWFMRKADYITIPIEAAKVGYFVEFHSKIKIIPQGFKISNLPEVDEYKPNPIPTFLYAGSLNPVRRDPRPLLDYLTGLDENFLFYIYTHRFDLVKPYVSGLKGKLVVAGYVPRPELLKKMATMDFLVNFDNNTAVHLPSKLIDYTIVNRPVLNITPNFDKNRLMSFLSGNYSDAMPFADIEPYRIENVCNKFLSAANEQN